MGKVEVDRLLVHRLAVKRLAVPSRANMPRRAAVRRLSAAGARWRRKRGWTPSSS